MGGGAGRGDYLRNQQRLDYTGLTLDGALGWGWRDIFHPDDLPGLVASWRAALAAEQPLQAEARVRRLDGAYRWFLILAVYAVDLRGRGRSDGDRFYVGSFDDYLRDVDAMVGVAASQHPGLPLFVLRHSAGGVLACHEQTLVKALPPGAFYTEPAGEPHFARTGPEGATVSITGYGPTDTVLCPVGRHVRRLCRDKAAVSPLSIRYRFERVAPWRLRHGRRSAHHRQSCKGYGAGASVMSPGSSAFGSVRT